MIENVTIHHIHMFIIELPLKYYRHVSLKLSESYTTD